jgi:hypothetical protein
MKILHIAPHYGGGIAPAVVGIFEATNATHVLIEIEETQDSVSLRLLKQFNAQPQSISVLLSKLKLLDNFDVVIFHYWETDLWSKLTIYDEYLIAGRLVFLNHRSIIYNRGQAVFIGKLFQSCIQSGFTHQGLPKNWTLIPTCSSKDYTSFPKTLRKQKAVYIGTLAYKKVAQDFFDLAGKLLGHGITLDIYGKQIDSTFLKNTQENQNENLKYCGYAVEKLPILSSCSYFFYPLDTNHYGTTENALLEAMLAGALPLVRDNVTEREILGDELMAQLNIDVCLQSKRSDIFSNGDLRFDLSERIRSRALELIRVDFRTSGWNSVLFDTSTAPKSVELSSVAQRMLYAIRKFPTRN